MPTALYRLVSRQVQASLTDHFQQHLHPGQFGKKRRNPAMATHHVLAQVRHLNNTGRSAVVVLLDVSNAYGSLPHSLLFSLMERLGFPLDVMKLLKAVYGGGTYIPMDRGPPFKTACGIRQG